MKYQYNSDLTFEERVVQTASEIKEKYRDISVDDAIHIAAISHPIDDKVTNDDKFDRLYNTMLIIDKDHEEFLNVFNDAFNLYEKGLKNDSYNNIMKEIIDYIEGNRPTFPYLVEVE